MGNNIRSFPIKQKLIPGMKYLILLILQLLVFSACTKELKVDFGEPSKKIVLYPVVTNNQKITIKMSGTAGILSPGFPVLENPTVVITDNNVPVDTVIIDKKGNGYSKIIPVPEHEYTFTATATGYQDAVCVTQLPGPVIELKADTSYLYLSWSKQLKTRLKLKDDPNEINYYKVALNLKQNITTRVTRKIGNTYVSYDSSFISIHKIEDLYANMPDMDFFRYGWRNQYLLAQDVLTFNDESTFRISLGSEIYIRGSEFYFSDKLFNGGEMMMDIILGGEIKSYYPAKYLIELSSISEDFYLGVKSYARYGTKESANLPASEEVSIYSSVKGGYGFPISSTTLIDSSYSKPRY
ncbi:MAG: DUF4249 family protein [Methanosarcina sp.]